MLITVALATSAQADVFGVKQGTPISNFSDAKFVKAFGGACLHRTANMAVAPAPGGPLGLPLHVSRPNEMRLRRAIGGRGTLSLTHAY